MLQINGLLTKTKADEVTDVCKQLGVEDSSGEKAFFPGLVTMHQDNNFSYEYSKHYCELPPEKFGKCNWFKSIFLASKKNFQSYWYLRSKGAIHQEIMRQRNSKYWYIVHPFSLLRLCWEVLMLHLTFFSTVFLPFKLAFLNSMVAKYYLSQGRSIDHIMKSIYIDLAVSTMWLLDSFGYFITGYYDENLAKCVMQPKSICYHYLPRFLIDLSTSLPVEALLFLYCGDDYFLEENHLRFIIVQLYYWYTIVRFRYYITYCYKIGRLGNFKDLSIRIFWAVIIYFWVISWSLYFSLIIPQMVYGNEVFKNVSNSKETQSWIQNVKLFDKSLWGQYQYSFGKAFFMNIGISTFKNMFSLEEYVIAIIIGIIGRIYWIYFLTWFLESITAAHALRVKFLLIQQQLNEYMKQKDVPVFLKKRVKRFYFYRFQSHNFRDRVILRRLPDSLRKEIGLYTCQKLIHNTEVFQSLPKRVVVRLVQSMYREMYFPNDVILRANTFGECMYFICSGTVSVSTTANMEICHLEDGDFFGEIALVFEDRKRTATITAVTITEVYRLEAADYKKIIEKYPDVYKRLEQFAAQRLRMLISIGYKPSAE